MTPEQHETYKTQHLQIGLASGVGWLADAVGYAGMAHSDPMWIDNALKSISYAEERIEEFKKTIAAILANEIGSLTLEEKASAEPVEFDDEVPF